MSIELIYRRGSADVIEVRHGYDSNVGQRGVQRSHALLLRHQSRYGSIHFVGQVPAQFEFDN